MTQTMPTTQTTRPMQTAKPPNDEPAIRFRHAAKSFGPVHAVAGIDLDVRRGETVALLGRNGAGKSTAISLLLGLNEPDAGSVRLFGQTPAQAVRSGRVGAMLQEGRAVPRITVRELIGFVARTYPAPCPSPRRSSSPGSPTSPAAASTGSPAARPSASASPSPSPATRS